MKKSASPVKKGTRGTKRPVDRVAAEFAEVKARKIPARDLVWMFRFTASNDRRRQAAVADCVEFLADELGKRCRVVLETATVGRLKFQDFILKVPEMTPTLLRKLDWGMAECCRRMKVKYYFLGYGEEVYKHASWKTLGTVLQPVEPPPESVGDLDCRKLRFDGLYFNKTGDSDGDYLRFYPGRLHHFAYDGEVCVILQTPHSLLTRERPMW